MGCQAELHALRSLMQKQRMVILKALDGIGKTRIALELAREAVVYAE